MGQYWTWYCVSTSQNLGNWGKYGEWIGSDWARQLLPLLGMYEEPVNPLEGQKVPDALAIVKNETVESRATLGSLPVEVHLCIFVELTDYKDALCYALTNTFIWSLGYDHLARLRKQNVCPWMGGAIICLGDYADHLPERLLQDTEVLQAKAFQEAMGDYQKMEELSCELPGFPGTDVIFGGPPDFGVLRRVLAGVGVQLACAIFGVQRNI